MRIIVYSRVRLFSEVLAGWLKSQGLTELVKPCCHLESLIKRVKSMQPDIVLFDICGERSLDEARVVTRTFPEIRLLALALPEVADEVIACADAGFIGYFPRDASLEELYPIIQQTMSDECACHPQIAASLLKELRRRQEPTYTIPPAEHLTQRESEILALLGHGMCNKEIARDLRISVATVKNHLHNVFSKLHVGGRLEAVAKLQEAPWLAKSA